MTAPADMQAAFTRDICERPDDDTPRLIFADWLEEQDTADSRARAAFIRDQVSDGRPYAVAPGQTELRIAIWSPRVWARVPETPTLARANMPEVLVVELPPWHQGADVHRGFISTIRCTCRQWLDHGAELVLQQPVAALRLADKEPMYSSNFWMWMAEQDPDYARDFLPEAWFPENESSVRFDTRDDAFAWASDRAIVWARKQAGLPPLPRLTAEDIRKAAASTPPFLRHGGRWA